MTSSFTHYWEQRKLGDMLERYEDPVETPHDGYERIGIRSHAKGVFHGYVEPGKELDTAKMHRVAADKFILNITFAWEHAVAITEEEDAGTLVSHRFPQFSFHKELKSHFFKFLMLDRKFREYLELCSPGGAGRNRVLNINDMLKYKINVPSVEEQTKIGEYFDNLDNLITLHQRKPLTNSYYINPWEQRKLSDLIIEYKETVDSDCTLPVLTSSKAEGIVLQEEHFGRVQNHDITGYNILPRNYCTYRNRSDGVDFTFNINRCCDKGIISKFYPVFYGNNSDIFFISMVLNYCDEVVHEIAYTCTGTGQKVLSFLDLQKMNIRVPSYDEQKKISRFFEQLDNLITLHRRMFISQKRRAYKCIKRQ